MATYDAAAVRAALAGDDLGTLTRLLQHPRAVEELNVGWFGLSSPPLLAVKSTEAMSLLMERGAELEPVSGGRRDSDCARSIQRLPPHLWIVGLS